MPDSPPAMPNTLTGMPVKWPSSAFLWDEDKGCLLNTLLASAVSEPRWYTGSNSLLLLALAAENRKTWLCQEPDVYFVWALLMYSLRDWLESVHTANNISFWIIKRLTEWFSNEPFLLAYTDMPGLLLVILAQDQIGWLAFFEGCIAVEWSGVQEAHYLWLGHRNTGKRWATSLIVKLWEIAWDLWDHRNQIKNNLVTAQDLAHRDSILLAVRSEYATGRSAFLVATGASSNARY
jgi:hypothetical protein